MHLDIAEQILVHPKLAAPIRSCLADHWSAFYLGSIAADYQSIGNVPREATHFYGLPMAVTEAVGWDKLQLEHPELADSSNLDVQSAIFLAAYGAHLHYDVVWYKQILVPFFWLSDRWEGVSKRDRFTVHNMLLTYLSGVSLARLPVSAETTLAAAHPNYAMPFIDIALLSKWQQLIVDQLAPGAPIHTVQIYAERLGMTPDEFAAKLRDQAWLQSQLFDRVPLAAVEEIFEQALDESVQLINSFLGAFTRGTAT